MTTKGSKNMLQVHWVRQEVKVGHYSERHIQSPQGAGDCRYARLPSTVHKQQIRTFSARRDGLDHRRIETAIGIRLAYYDPLVEEAIQDP
jgi:hypothetical protein